MKTPVALSPQALRRRADAIARTEALQTSGSDQVLSPEALQKTLNELRVHQIELEMQNDELRQAQLNLDAERERYFDLYDLAPVGYCTVNAQGFILEANLTAATLLGTARRSLVKEPFSQFIHPADKDHYYLSRKRLLETGQTQSSVLQMVARDGKPFWASLVASVAQGDASVAVTRIVLSDVSERKQVEQALQDSEQRFRQLFENNSSVMLLIEPGSGQIVDANQTAAAYYGYPPKRLIGMSINDINTLSAQRIAEEMQRAVKEKRSHFFFLHRLASGEVREVEVHSTPISVGGRTELMSIVHDISARAQADRQLASVMREQAAILNSGIAGIVKLKDRQILWSNAAFADMLGYGQQELSRQATRLCYPSDEAYAAFAQAAYPVIQNGQVFQGEVQFRRKDGSLIWVRVNGALLEPKTNESIWSLVDIDQGKLAELVLKQSEQRLGISEKQMVIAQRISGTGSWTYNLATDKIWGSAEGLRIFGYAAVARDLPIAEIEACIVERERVHQALQDLISECREYDLEYTVKPADGSAARIVHSVATLETDEQGKPLMVLGFVQDITKTKHLEEQIRQLAFFDPLTALPNRRLLLDRLNQALSATQRSACYGAVMFLDLDNFKPLNDSHGHGAGDLLLIEVARRLNQCIRAMDTVSRIGGDEFVVLIGGLAVNEVESTEKAGKVAKKILHALARPYLLSSADPKDGLAGISHQCSASIGVVLFSKLDQDPESLLKAADAAMYQAKHAGRNRVRFRNQILS